MSIRVTSHVWETSAHHGSKLLLLLAIADAANDDGESWPGIPYLAKKARTTDRNAQKIIDALEESGELVVETNKGKKTKHGWTNRYTVVTSWNRPALVERGVLTDISTNKEVNTRTPQEVNTRTPQEVNTRTPKPLLEPSVEPSIKDSSSSGDEDSTTPDPEPIKETHQELIDIVSKAFNNTNYGYVAKLKKYLVADTTPEDGKYHQWRLDAPMSGAEILGYRLWREDEDRPMPSVAETLQRTIEEFRGLPDYSNYVARGQLEVDAARFEAAQLKAAESPAAGAESEALNVQGAPEENAPDLLIPDPAAVQAILDALAQKLRG